MQVEEAIRERRTLKAFTEAPVDRELVSELLELACETYFVDSDE